jgi:lipopolysaccharide transport system permease protein
MVKKDLRSRYKGSFLGFLWTFVNPMLQLLVYSIVFPYILKNTEENFPLFLFIALLPWIMFAGSIQTATTCIVSNGNMVKKVYFPRQVLPLSVATTHLVNYLYSFAILIPVLLIFKIPLSFRAFSIIAPIAILYLLSIGFSLLLSSLYVKFRDLEHIISIITMAWFYLTPIVFPISIFPDDVAAWIGINPLVAVVEAIRNPLLYDKVIDFQTLGYPLIFAIVTLLIGAVVFSIQQKSFAEEL